jgi:NAD(P)-dependent dehydrogenase (short-subunit alcohol dehydrogenase family)
MRFDGKAVIVTGGALGIGQAASELLAERGASVAIFDWNEEAGNSTCDKITKSGGKAIFEKVDVANQRTVETATNGTVKTFGRLDSLIVSAGIQRYGTAVTTPNEQWDEVMNVNLRGAWNAARAVIPKLLETGGGTIVNVSSVQALASQQNVLAYTVSKHGLIGLTRSIAMDFAKQNIRANAVCPGTVDTPMLEWAASLDPDPGSVYEACRQMHPLGRIATAREIAEVVVFLAHSSSSFVTGAVWTVDGGLLTQIGGSPKTEKLTVD